MRGRYATGMSARGLRPASLDALADESVSPLVRKAAAWSWRLLVLLAAIVALLWIFFRLEILFVPVMLATILAALLMPVVDFLDKRGAPRSGAVALVLLSGIALFGGLLAFVVNQFIEGAPALADQVTASIEGVGTWLTDGPLDVSPAQINEARDAAIEALQSNQEKLTSGALSTAGTLTEILTGALLVWYYELDALINPQWLQVEPPAAHSEPLSPFALRDQVDAAYPDANVHWMMLAPPDAHSPVRFFLSAKAGAPPRPR